MTSLRSTEAVFFNFRLHAARNGTNKELGLPVGKSEPDFRQISESEIGFGKRGSETPKILKQKRDFETLLRFRDFVIFARLARRLLRGPYTNNMATETDPHNVNENDVLLLENLTKFITCPSCKETMNDPVLLPCLDSICRSCCQKSAQKHGNMWNVLCRLCDSLVGIPQTSELKTNFFACNVKNYLRCCLDENDAVICSNCDENSALADARCLDCNEFLCRMCLEAHRRIKLTREHQVIFINEEKPLKIFQSLHVNLECWKHKDEKLLLRYCANCNEPLCLSCVVEHANLQHKVEEFGGGALARRLFKVRNIFDKCLEMRKVLYISMEGVEAEKKELENQTLNCKEEIIEASKKIIEAVTARQNLLLNDLELVSDCKKQALDYRIMKHRKELSSIERVKVFIDNALGQGNLVERLSVLRTVENRVKEIKAGHMSADFLYTGSKTRYLEFTDNSQSDRLKTMIEQWGRIGKEPVVNSEGTTLISESPPDRIFTPSQVGSSLTSSQHHLDSSQDPSVHTPPTVKSCQSSRYNKRAMDHTLCLLNSQQSTGCDQDSIEHTPCSLNSQQSTGCGKDTIDHTPCSLNSQQSTGCDQGTIDHTPCSLNSQQSTGCDQDTIDHTPCSVNSEQSTGCDQDTIDHTLCSVNSQQNTGCDQNKMEHTRCSVNSPDYAGCCPDTYINTPCLHNSGCDQELGVLGSSCSDNSYTQLLSKESQYHTPCLIADNNPSMRDASTLKSQLATINRCVDEPTTADSAESTITACEPCHVETAFEHQDSGPKRKRKHHSSAGSLKEVLSLEDIANIASNGIRDTRIEQRDEKCGDEDKDMVVVLKKKRKRIIDYNIDTDKEEEDENHSLSEDTCQTVNLDSKRTISDEKDKRGDQDQTYGVVLPSRQQLHEIHIIGCKGRNSGEFNLPFGAAFDKKGNRLLVCDMTNQRIQVFNPDGKFIMQFGKVSKKARFFKNPGAIAVGPTGVIYVADCDHNNIHLFDKKGVFLRKFGEKGKKKGQLRCPLGLAVLSSGNLLVVDKDNGRLQVFTDTGAFFKVFAKELDLPRFVAIHNERVYVTEPRECRVSVFDCHGNRLFRFGRKGCADGELNEPTGIATNSKGHVIVSDHSNHRVQVFTADGAFITKVENPSTGKPKGHFEQAEGVAVDQEDRVYVCDTVNHRIQVIPPFWL